MALLRSATARRFLESVTAGVFRSTGDGLESPAQLPGLATWYDASDVNSMRTAAGAVPANGDAVALVADKSGNSAVNCLVLNGVAGNNYGWAPDSAALSITGEIDLRADIAATTYTPVINIDIIAKRSGSAGEYVLRINQTTGALSMFWYAGAAIQGPYNSTVTLPAAGVTAFQRIWVRVTRTATSVTFYTSSDGSTWTQLGDAVDSSAASSATDSAVALSVGASDANFFSGLIYRAQIYNGINGTLAFDANFTTQTKLAPSFTESSANAATVQILSTGATGARISGARDRYWGGLAATLPVLTIAATGNFLTGNGTSTSMKSAPFNLPQPVTRATVLKQKTWTAGDVLLDGNSANSGAVVQTTSTPQINLNAGSSVAGNTGLALNARAVLTQTINGASSALRVNRGTPTTGNAGATAPNGGTVFSDGAGANFADMELCEDITYSVDLPASAKDAVALYCGRKWGFAV